MKNNSQKAGSHFFDGFPVFVPNDCYDGDGFYISFNKYDSHIYGDVTTALVVGQGEKFYILNGDHRENYFPLISLGFDACFEYFKSNSDKINKYSDKEIK